MKISAVILNRKRPCNLEHVILPALEKYSCVDEIIISHCKEETTFEYESGHCRVVHRHDHVENHREYGMGCRFLAGKNACNDVILLLDDDVIMPESSLLALCDEFTRDPDVIHSLYGRNPGRQLSYSARRCHGEVTYALAGAALLSKRLAGLFFEYAPLVAGLVRAESKQWPFCGEEDLFMSLVAVRINRRLNRAHPFPRVELRVSDEGTSEALCERPAPMRDRTLFSQFAIPALGVADLVKVSSCPG